MALGVSPYVKRYTVIVHRKEKQKETKMIAEPITRKEAYNLIFSTNTHLLGTILRRLVYAGAKSNASQALDNLSEPLEKYMTTEKCWYMGYPEKLGWDWMKIRDAYYANRHREKELA